MKPLSYGIEGGFNLIITSQYYFYFCVNSAICRRYMTSVKDYLTNYYLLTS